MFVWRQENVPVNSLENANLPHTSDLDGGHNINSRNDQQELPHPKLTESPIQERNLSGPKNYVNVPVNPLENTNLVIN
ncbi:34098_t:CDS:2 [Gigaspora margarita]|uniref:34098_t:CDS:1 n=1 Tax=Gigaspora margarita TaxID=4874 RepID=A0ABN7UFK8_GIGMA|nr:34098_t:CDS:2 [Gigaspora margarita]